MVDVTRNCPMCGEEHPSSQFIRLECGHLVGRECTKQLFMGALESELGGLSKMVCPIKTCEKPIKDGDMIDVLGQYSNLLKEAKEKWKNQELNKD